MLILAAPQAFSPAYANATAVNNTYQGTLFHDSDRLTDDRVDGIGIGAPDGVQMYAYLIVDATDLVEVRTAIAADGTYQFTSVEGTIAYDIAISTKIYDVGDVFLTDDVAPNAIVYPPDGWFLTGEYNGGRAQLDDSPDGTHDLLSLGQSVFRLDFGIDRYFAAPTCAGGLGDLVEFEWDDGTGAGFDWPAGTTSMTYTVNYTDSGGAPQSLDATMTLSDPNNRNADSDLRSPHPYDTADNSCNALPNEGNEYTDGDVQFDPWDSDCTPFFTETNGDFGDEFLSIQMLSVDHTEAMTFSVNFSQPVQIVNFTASDIDYQGLLDSSLDEEEMPGHSYQDELTFMASNGSGAPIDLSFTAGSNITVTDNTVLALYDINESPFGSPESGENMVVITSDDLISNFSWAYSNGPDDAASEQNNADAYSWWSDNNGATNGVSDNHAVRVSGFSLCVPETPTLLYSIGNWVWLEDDNPDGVYFSPTESGIDNVTVELWNGEPNVGGSAMISSTLTVDGAYSFDNLAAGTYYVHIPASNFLPNGALYSTVENSPYDVTSFVSGEDDVMVGTGDPNVGVSSGSVVVGDGNQPLEEEFHNLRPIQDDAQTEWNVDFGFYVPSSLAVTLVGVSTQTEPSLLVPMLAIVFVISAAFVVREFRPKT